MQTPYFIFLKISIDKYFLGCYNATVINFLKGGEYNDNDSFYDQFRYN